ncbi:hypothetical protein LTR28_003517 [Elasticomyces elasticus]|nr:hypothetical protein LTR28_003517 [Elasticomyces elasticus]
MPLRLQLLSGASVSSLIAKPTPIPSFLLPFLHHQHRPASILSSLSDNPGAYNRRIRRGRGPSSGKGKTSGRGHKGQKQHGKVPRGFNGGQTPDIVVSGERGFENHLSLDMSPINLTRIQAWIDNRRLDPTQPITLRELAHSRCLHGVKDGVKLLARGARDLRTPINIVVSRASAAAIEAVEKVGGTVVTRYYSKPAIGRILRGETDPIVSLQTQIAKTTAAGSTMPEAEAAAELRGEDVSEVVAEAKKYRYRLPDATGRKDLEYYRDPAHRGYLSYLVGEGQGPSLFFKTPGVGRFSRKKVVAKGGKSVVKGENRVW